MYNIIFVHKAPLPPLPPADPSSFSNTSPPTLMSLFSLLPFFFPIWGPITEAQNGKNRMWPKDPLPDLWPTLSTVSFPTSFVPVREFCLCKQAGNSLCCACACGGGVIKEMWSRKQMGANSTHNSLGLQGCTRHTRYCADHFGLPNSDYHPVIH